MKTKDFIIGLVLVCLGFLFLADNLDLIHLDFTNLWPILIVLIGLAFGIGYLYNRKNYGLLMPATIFTLYGLLFWYCVLTDWDTMHILWPMFLIGPGLGFYFMYLLGGKEKGLLVPAGILVGLGLIFLLRFGIILKYWSLILIVIGIYLIYKHFKEGNKTDNYPD
jgi:LiaI-LiaF-like transmembrane region